MKTSKYLKTIAFCALMLAAAMPGKAQVFPNTYINIDWQVGVPLGAGFADKASGWGMNFEGGYFVTPAITVGPFISYQTNLQSISRQTLDLGNGSALTTNQKHALFQLPFGVTGRYNWLTDSVFQPYAGLKLGANYAEMSSYYYIIKQYTDTWGFYLSPEIGAQGHAHLPVDVDVGVGEYLRFARQGRGEHEGAESDGFEVFRCFHNRTIFLLLNYLAR